MRITHSLGLLLVIVGACGDDASSPIEDGTASARGKGGRGTRWDAGTVSPMIDASAPESGATQTDGGSTTPTTPTTPSTGATAASKLAMALRGRSSFLIGMGNDHGATPDQAGAYTLGTTLDLHYLYLVGLAGRGGWPDWNPNGSFVDIHVNVAAQKNTVPMFTLYTMAAAGENNMGVLTDDSYMAPYWAGMRLLYQRLAAFNKPAVVHLEPDFWAFAQQHSANADAAAHVTSLVPECAGLTNDVAGMGQCLVKLARAIAPKVALGFHASSWAGSTTATLAFLKRVGADKADFIATDVLDRDAGCFEVGTDPNCQRGGTFYWDETNQTSPNFHEHFAWAKAIYTGLGTPILWWQVPFGVPSNTPGGTPGHYRDNRVKYFFAHTDELVAAGGVGAVFGTGAGNQTYITSDGGQFKNAVTSYFAKPTAIP